MPPVAGRSWRRIPTWVGYPVVFAAFVVSRIVYWLNGVRFDLTPIDNFMQLLDSPLLRDRLLESLFYLHAQPPFYNLLTGIALKLAPSAPEWVLVPVFAGSGLYLGGCLYFILLRLHLPSLLAALVAAAMVVSPPFALYENWYFYPHLNVTWLVGAVAWLARSRGRAGTAMLVAAAHLAGLVFTRSLFHPLFFFVAAGLVVSVIGREERLRAVVAFSLPGLLVLALCLKNFTLFGFVGTSSWASRNFGHAVTEVLGEERVDAVRKREKFATKVKASWFEPGNRNAELFNLKLRRTRIPALDQVLKTAPPHQPNFNHLSYPVTQARFGADAWRLIATYPLEYARGLASTTLPRFFLPVTSDVYFERNRRAIHHAARGFDRLDGSAWARGLVAVGLLLALRRLVSRRCPTADRLVFALAFCAIVWVGVVGLIGESGENYRFRYKVLWLTWVVALGGFAVIAPRIMRFARMVLRSLLPARG